ncbi:DUF1641 domain-containing protein [Methanolobus sediminis]|uniref:DUF1641 domain-containing protein n=1 Tax=Methanolobus sediminis TaxID=3072978 RepID=A0AA51ULT5_9EURY|nr:DUF1641 domain-containing protein [Methanolobus sediminis]WMW25725.1 DUF1641 domain-containing protein [Methanolobus sediminis]
MENDNIPTNIPIAPEDMDAFLDLIRTARIMQDYMNDQTAHGIAEIMTTMFKLINAAMSTDMVEIMERAVQDPELDKAILNPPKVGLGGLIKQMGDEDFQKGMGVLLTFVKAIGRATEE